MSHGESTSLIHSIQDLAARVEFEGMSSFGYGSHGQESSSQSHGLSCVFVGHRVERLTAMDMDIEIEWEEMASANDNGAARVFFPNAIHFHKGDQNILQAWCKRFDLMQAAHVA